MVDMITMTMLTYWVMTILFVCWKGGLPGEAAVFEGVGVGGVRAWRYKGIKVCANRRDKRETFSCPHCFAEHCGEGSSHDVLHRQNYWQPSKAENVN